MSFGYGFFPVICLHRQDLEDFGFDVSEVSDEKLKELADRIGDFWVESGEFWDILIEFAESMGFKRVDSVDRRGFCIKCRGHWSEHENGQCVVQEDRWPKKKVF